MTTNGWISFFLLICIGDACHEFSNNGEEKKIGGERGVDSSGWGGGGIFPPRAPRGLFTGKAPTKVSRREKWSFKFFHFFCPLPAPHLLSPPPFSIQHRTRANRVLGIVYADEKLHARRGNKRLNFSRGVVRLFNWNQPFRGYKCTGDEM